MSSSVLGAAVTSHPGSSTHSLTAIRRVGLFLMLAGLGFVVLAIAAPAALAAFYDLVASPGTMTTMDAGTRFGAGLFGALTFGWGVTVHQLGLARTVLRAILVGTLAWFVVDSTASILLGYAWNALSNAGFVAVVLLLTRGGSRRA